jgi:hypothetical protein
MAITVGGMSPEAFTAALPDMPAKRTGGRTHYKEDFDPVAEKGTETATPELEAGQSSPD